MTLIVYLLWYVNVYYFHVKVIKVRRNIEGKSDFHVYYKPGPIVPQSYLFSVLMLYANCNCAICILLI